MVGRALLLCLHACKISSNDSPSSSCLMYILQTKTVFGVHLTSLQMSEENSRYLRHIATCFIPTLLCVSVNVERYTNNMFNYQVNRIKRDILFFNKKCNVSGNLFLQCYEYFFLHIYKISHWHWQTNVTISLVSHMATNSASLHVQYLQYQLNTLNSFCVLSLVSFVSSPSIRATHLWTAAFDFKAILNFWRK